MPHITLKLKPRACLRALLSLILLLLLLLMVGSIAACGTDEDTVEGKRCEYGSDDPDLQCVEGYRCVPGPDGAFCEKEN
jgi:hypothetical protein